MQESVIGTGGSLSYLGLFLNWPAGLGNFLGVVTKTESLTCVEKNLKFLSLLTKLSNLFKSKKLGLGFKTGPESYLDDSVESDEPLLLLLLLFSKA